MADWSKTLTLADADATAHLAAQIGARLEPGDTLLLEGSIGAGKTHFARALILSLLTAPEDIPSPTFTLVQTYDAPKAEIWHADLYRLTDTSELVELGLDDAFEEAICLIEWPDRLGTLRPKGALTIALALTEQEGARTATLSGPPARWNWLDDTESTP